MSAPARRISGVASTCLLEPPHTDGRRHRWTRTTRIIIALTFLGIVFNMVITIDPGPAELSSIVAPPRHSPPLTHVETVPLATAAALARAADTIASGVGGLGSAASTAQVPDATPPALTSMSGPGNPAATRSDLAAAGSIGTGDSMLSRVGASITAVVRGLIPVVPPVMPLSTVDRIAAAATSSSGFYSSQDDVGPAVLVLVGAWACAMFSARRFADERARLAWSFVAPLLRPG